MIALGALFGCLIAGPAVDLLGRKVAIIAGAIPLELGWLLLFFAKNRLMLYAGRVITGVGCGIETLAVAVSSNLVTISPDCEQSCVFSLDHARKMTVKLCKLEKWKIHRALQKLGEENDSSQSKISRAI